MADDDTRELQALLNRTGGLLAVDGIAGPDTRRAIAEARQLAGLPAGSNADRPLLDWLRAQPRPSPDLGAGAVAFIAREEVGNRADYDRVAARPHWPGGASGITIGIGYDLRFNASAFRPDWGGLLAPGVPDALEPHLGCRGSRERLLALGNIRVGWPAAWRVFVHRSLPACIAATRDAFPGFDTLPGPCRGALASLVYNRGAGMADTDRRREMRAIRAALERGALDAVPGLILAMQRLWPDAPGLRARRAREAAMWQSGLRGDVGVPGETGRQ